MVPGRSGCHVTGRAIFSQIGESWCANTGGGVSPGCQGQRRPAAAMLPNELLCLPPRLLPWCPSSLSRMPFCTYFQLFTRSVKKGDRPPRKNGQGSHTATWLWNPQEGLVTRCTARETHYNILRQYICSILVYGFLQHINYVNLLIYLPI